MASYKFKTAQESINLYCENSRPQQQNIWAFQNWFIFSFKKNHVYSSSPKTLKFWYIQLLHWMSFLAFFFLISSSNYFFPSFNIITSTHTYPNRSEIGFIGQWICYKAYYLGGYKLWAILVCKEFMRKYSSLLNVTQVVLKGNLCPTIIFIIGIHYWIILMFIFDGPIANKVLHGMFFTTSF